MPSSGYDVLKEIESDLSEVDERIDHLKDMKDMKQEEIEEHKQDLLNHVKEEDALSEVDYEFLKKLFEDKYVMLPKSKEESFVVAPRMFDFQVGWLHKQTPAFNVFVVNKYINWINELPEDIKKSTPGLGGKFDGDVSISDGMAEFDKESDRDKAFNEYRDRFTRRKDDDQIYIDEGSEFDLIADMIDDGELPFNQQPIDDDDLRDEADGIELRSYQERAWDKFLDTGQVGIYWSPGAGKTFVSLYAGDRLKGKKLIVVPNNTLKEQWLEHIHGSDEVEQKVRYPSEWVVETYHKLTQSKNPMEKLDLHGLMLTVFDESHRLPANTFSKLATIDTKYRIGLSASPYREDGRTEYIFALTGYPVGLKWRELIELGVVDEPEVTVMIYNTMNKKREDLKSLVNEYTGKILIFCDSIDRGKDLSEELGVPFIHGDTTNRLETFRENRVVISSRVGDEGLSLDDVDVVIEHDFHGGSKRQEAQRVGRLMHNDDSDNNGQHIVQMTQEELDKFDERLYHYEEHGFDVRFENREG